MLDQAESTQAKLLIVDDKAANLDLLREMLAPLGHQIFFATSGAKALSVAASVLPDLVLLDVMMPEMDGFETCLRLKREPTHESSFARHGGKVSVRWRPEFVGDPLLCPTNSGRQRIEYTSTIGARVWRSTS